MREFHQTHEQAREDRRRALHLRAYARAKRHGDARGMSVNAERLIAMESRSIERRVARFLSRARSRNLHHDVEDVAAEVNASLARTEIEAKNVPAFKALRNIVADRRCIEHLRRPSIEAKSLDDEPDRPPRPGRRRMPDTCFAKDASEYVPDNLYVGELFRSEPERNRRALFLKLYVGLSSQETADEISGLTAANVDQMVCRFRSSAARARRRMNATNGVCAGA